MTYFKIDDKQYLDYLDYRKIITVSGEILQINEVTFKLTKDRYPNIINNICHNAVYDKKNDIIIEKTEEMKNKEVIQKQCDNILEKIQPLMIAMNFQENGINKGANSEKAFFSNQEIKEWAEYISEIANNNINTPIPSLSEKAKRIFKIDF